MGGKDGELLFESKYPAYEFAKDRKFTRKLKVFGSEKETYWKRLAILPNVDGQKYTLGNRFTSREEQGEFIFLSETTVGRSLGAEEGPIQWEITVENGHYFVTPITAGSKVCHNRFKIRSKTRLEFGDTLTLVNNGTLFLFKVRELKPEFMHDGASVSKNYDRIEEAAQNHSQNADIITEEFIPGQNPLILSHILSYLPITELKTVRFVSKFWNEECFKILSERCVLTLDLNGSSFDTIHSMELFRHSIEMRNRAMQNWTITIYEPGPKLLEDLNYFIFDAKPQIDYIKRLDLGVTIRSRDDYELQIKLLQFFAKGLKEFTWSGSWYLDTATGKDYPFPENIGLSKLQVFNLSLCLWEESGHSLTKYCSSFTWLKKLVISIQGVTRIQLKCPAKLSLTFLNILQESENFKLFSNLSEIRLGGINPDVIQSLLKLEINKPLKKLGLSGWEDINNSDLAAIDQLLFKYSKTLESLEFMIPSNTEEIGSGFINFPMFPNLEFLSVGCPDQCRGMECIKLKFSDGTENINYKTHFPRLKHLKLWPQEYSSNPGHDYPEQVWQEGTLLHEMFFPAIVEGYDKEIEVCSTLQRLEVLSLVGDFREEWIFFDHSKKPIFSKEKEAVLVIAKMFPNVTNEWINSF